MRTHFIFLLMLFMITPIIAADTNYSMTLKLTGVDNECLLYTSVGDIIEFEMDGKLKHESLFQNQFSIYCETQLDELIVNIYDLDDNFISYNEYTNISRIRYDPLKVISKEYIISLYIQENFNKSNRCILKLDNTNINYRFDGKTSLKDKIITNYVGNHISFTCTDRIKKVILIIDDRKYEKEVYFETYTDTKSIVINIDKTKLKPLFTPPVKVDQSKEIERILNILIYMFFSLGL